MNQPSAFAAETPRGYVGRFRVAWRSEAFDVRTGRDGDVLYFGSPEEAELAAWRIKHKIEEPHYRRSGEMVSSARSAAEALFKPILKQRGKTRVIEVERR